MRIDARITIGLLIALLIYFPLPANALDQWYNSSWHFRQKIEINASGFERQNWPVELQMNFTDLLRNAGASNLSFDNNSLRVFEYNSSGSLLFEAPSQFDVADTYNADNNAIGELVFIMNGTTPLYRKRIYHVYFDSLVNGRKTAPSYSTPLAYAWDGEEFNVNNSELQWFVDTRRGENTSGIYQVIDFENNLTMFNDAAPDKRTLEFTEYTNGTSNFSFNFANSATFIAGPVRVTAKLVGNESLWNNPNATTVQGTMIKTYKFYNLGSWIKVEQNFTNIAASSITRGSTPSGALTFEAQRAFTTYVPQDNTTEPYSWSHASDTGNTFGVGIVNLNESGTANFLSTRSDSLGRIGINLSSVLVPSFSSITETAVMKFNGTFGDLNSLKNLSLSFLDNSVTALSAAEAWKVNFTVSSNNTIYNRNETVIIRANITGDVYNFTSSLNITLDNGTASPADDFNLTLFDDGVHNDLNAGDKVFGNNFTLSINATLGAWNISARVYGPDLLLLSTNSSTFNVTDIYNITNSIINPAGLVNRIVNSSIVVRNFRQDAFIAGASLSCNFALNTSIDHGNGTYSLSFQAPATPGAFTFNCTASKAGNAGSNSSNFTTEAAKTNATVTHSPSLFTATSITIAQGQNFSLQINSTNVGNGSANLANVTLQLPGNWSASNLTFACGNVSVGQTCVANFTITISNGTVPGNYSVNSTFFWQNPDFTAGSNSSFTTVIVTSNPTLNVTETLIYNIIAPGKVKAIGNFTIRSIGNDAVQNITFSATFLPLANFTFIPANVSSLSANSQISVQVNISLSASQSSGDYQGFINISSANGGNDSVLLNITISGANVSINANPQNFTANNITQTQNQSFVLQVNITNIRNATAFGANITLQLPSGIIANSSLLQCLNLSVGSNCTAAFQITVMNSTAPGTYLVNTSAVWNDIDDGIKTNTTQINITVLSNPVLEILESVVTGNATHGNTTLIGNFTIRSAGNDPLLNVSINLTGLVNFTITFTPSNLTNLSAGLQQTIFVNVTVPFAFDPGAQNGSINISASNAGFKNITLQVLVSVDRDWSMSPQSCEKTESPDAGLVCEVTINNTGNTFINFSISPLSANFSAVNASNFSIQKQSGFAFNVTYNVSGQPKQPYNATYVVSAVSSSSQPAARNLQISLVPFNALAVVLKITPLVIQNNQTVTIDVNVTDANIVGIKNVTANITLPNSTSLRINLSLINTIFNASGNLTQWRAVYPNATGSTALVGNYSVVVAAFDNIDVNGTTSSSFYAYPKLQITLQTLSSSYAKGSIASIYARVRDLGGTPLQYANVTLWVRDNSSILVFNQTFATAVSGIIEPLPTFTIPSDAVGGRWALFASTSYFDSNASVTIADSSNSTFEVLNASVSNVTFSGLLTDFKSSDLYFGGDTVEFAISVMDVNGAPLDPDSMNITVFSPNESVYSVINFSQINRSSIGLYFYKFVVQRNAASGVYRAELNATRGQFFNRNLALFRISSSLFADVETSFVWYPSSVMTFRMIVYTGDGMPIDPTALNLTVIDPAGNTYFSVQLGSMTKQSTGYYIYNFAMGANTSTGNYYAQVNATKDSSSTIKLKPFRVSQGGPYDVRIELLQNQVYPGDYLDFRVIIENKGEVSQDVTLEYWVSDGVQTWYYGSEAVLTPAFQNNTLIRSAYIFTSQPPKVYLLYGRVTYDLIKPPINVNYTFAVIPRPAASPTPVSIGVTAIPPPGVLATVSPSPSVLPFKDYSGMQIISYPDEVAIQAGEIKYPRIQVKNTGLVLLHNITIVLSGIPASWVEILPSRINALAPGDVATFVIKIAVPATERTAVRKVRAIVLSAERKEEALFDVAIFESKVALLEHAVQRLKERSEKLAKDAKEAEKAGKYMQAVYDTLDEVGKYIKEAEENLRGEQLDDALSSTQIADTLLGKASALLISAPFQPPPYAQLPNWITLALGVTGMSMGVLVFWFVRKRRKKKPEEQKPAAGTLEKVMEVLQKTDAFSLQKERNKIMRALHLLEDELHDGTISEAAYNELKKRYDRKIGELGKKLGEAK